jgi:hypothetical protein
VRRAVLLFGIDVEELDDFRDEVRENLVLLDLGRVVGDFLGVRGGAEERERGR